MPEEQGQGATPDANAATAGAGGQGAGGAAAGAGGGTGAQGAVATDADRRLANALEANARMAAERDTARNELRQIKEKDLPEAERTARKLTQLEQELATERATNRAAAIRQSATERATRLGFTDPLDAYLLVRDQLEVDDHGMPKNLDALLASLVKDKPYLVGRGRPNGSADQGSRGSGGAGQPFDMNQAIRAARGRAVVTTTTGD